MPLDAEKRRKYLADYRAKNKERISAYLSDYRKAHKVTSEKSAEYQREYRKRHPDRVIASREKQKPKMSEYTKDWIARNPQKVKLKNERAKIRAREKRAINKKPKPPAKTKEEKRESREIYRKTNIERITARNAEWRKRNKVKLASYFREYAKENSEKKNSQNRARYLSGASMRQYQRKYRKTNPAKVRSFRQKRRAYKKQAPIGCIKVIAAWDIEVRSKPRNCYWCQQEISGSDIELDHVIPLARGGAHEIGNLCVSCKTCNSRKQHRPLAVWNSLIANPVLF